MNAHWMTVDTAWTAPTRWPLGDTRQLSEKPSDGAGVGQEFNFSPFRHSATGFYPTITTIPGTEGVANRFPNTPSHFMFNWIKLNCNWNKLNLIPHFLKNLKNWEKSKFLMKIRYSIDHSINKFKKVKFKKLKKIEM